MEIIRMNFDYLVENMKKADLDPSKKAGSATSRDECVKVFQQFLDRKRVKYINDISENDFIQARHQKGAWTYSPPSDKEISSGQEQYLGYYIEKTKLEEDQILSIYESEIKGKFQKKEKVIKEEIEEKYSKWF